VPKIIRTRTLPVESATSDSDIYLTKTEEDQLSKEEASKRLQKANKIKEVLAGKIIKQEKMIESLTLEMDKIERDILTEKSSNSKNLTRVAELQREYEKYKADIEANQAKLKNMHEKHAVQVQDLQATISKQQGEIRELEEHKRMLRAEVLRLREESGNVTKEIEGYRSALNRMQKYFNAMFPTEGKKQGN
jgi:chromosome segregation ATPase